MDGAHPAARPRKPLTLVLCFDGTSNEFRNHVRYTGLSSDIIILFDIMIP